MRITDNVFALECTRGAYAYIIIGDDVTMIDTGRPGKSADILNELKSMDIDPVNIANILITHYDIDHTGNLPYLQKASGAAVWASEVDIPYIYGDKKLHGIKRLIPYSSRKDIERNLKVFEGGRLDGFEIIPTPGHTPGHVSIIYQDILFTGDLVAVSNGHLKLLPSLITWDRNTLIESVKKLASYDFRLICPAHGEPVEANGLWNELCSKF